MNFADLQNAWQSPRNHPAPAEIEHMKNRFLAKHARDRRAQRWIVYNAAALLTVATLAFAAFALGLGPGKGRFDLAREWGVLLLLPPPWIAVIACARQLARHDRAHHDPARSIADGVGALLDQTRVGRRRFRLIGWLYAAVLPPFFFVVHQLRLAGKAGDEILIPAYIICPLLLAAIFCALWWHDRRRLRPREHELQTLLRSYQ